ARAHEGQGESSEPAPHRRARWRSRPVDRRARMRGLQPLPARVPRPRLHHDGGDPGPAARDVERPRRARPGQDPRRHSRLIMRVVYEGSVAVNASDYTHPVARGDDYVDVEIEGLDDLVTRVSCLRFTLDYPFDKPYAGTVIGDAGVSLRQIIDAIRTGFRVIYRGAAHTEVPRLLNQIVDGDYGRAFH